MNNKKLEIINKYKIDAASKGFTVEDPIRGEKYDVKIEGIRTKIIKRILPNYLTDKQFIKNDAVILEDNIMPLICIPLSDFYGMIKAKVKK